MCFCHPRQCGDGKRTLDEACDDGDDDDSDGCSASCAIEAGYVCEPNFVGGKCVCAVPTKATVGLVAAAVTVDEGAMLGFCAADTLRRPYDMAGMMRRFSR